MKDILDSAKKALTILLDEAESRNYDPPASTSMVAELKYIIAKARGDKLPTDKEVVSTIKSQTEDMRLAEQHLTDGLQNFLNTYELYRFGPDDYETRLLELISEASNGKIQLVR